MAERGMDSTGGRGPLTAGTMTLVLGDVEGSTRRWASDRSAMAGTMTRFNEAIESAVAQHGGLRPIEQGEGDSFLAIFTRASDAVGCAIDLQRTFLTDVGLRVRMGLHTGEIDMDDNGRCGGDTVNRCARIRDLAHGGQVLISRPTCDLVIDRAPPSVGVCDLGSHRLRDLSRPEQLFQLTHPDLPASFPALASHEPRHNLPVALTSFVGRDSELAELGRSLAETRILTLTGAGGCGKTRLAMKLAEEVVDDYPDGVWWVDLGPVSDPTLVPGAVASAVSVRELPHEDISATLVRQLRERRVLIVLDNCEHLVAASAAIVETIARDCSGVTMLATSREPLGLSGETTWRVPSLPFPKDDSPLDGIETYDAVRLFVDRARRVRPRFELTAGNADAVRRVCQRLDGIPLAIELAAAQVRVLPPEQIAQGLAESFGLLAGSERIALPRQRTLEASVEWSYRLLSSKERLLLGKLSVFAGGFDLEAAEAVCTDASVGPYDVLDVLTRLVDKSLVNVDEAQEGGRYSLLETVRDYARRRLFDSDDASAVRHRHLDHFLSVALEHGATILSPERSSALMRLKADNDNLRAALDWAIQSGEANKACMMAGALDFYWVEHGHVDEALKRSEAILALGGASPLARMNAQMTLANAQLLTGNSGSARSIMEAALGTARELGERTFILRALVGLVYTLAFEGAGRGRAAAAEAAAYAREVGDDWQLTDALTATGNVEYYLGNLDRARASFDEAVKVGRRIGHHVGVAQALCLLGTTAHWAGDPDGSERFLTEALDISRALDARFWYALTLAFIGELALFRGDHVTGASVLEGAVEHGLDSSLFALAAARWRRAELWCDAGRLDEARAEIEEAEALLTALDVHWGAALARITKGDVAEAQGDRTTAASVWAEALVMAEPTANPIPIGRAKQRLSQVARWQGEFRRSDDLLHEALAGFVESSHAMGLVDAFEEFASLALDQDEFVEAARVRSAADALRRSIGYGRLPVAAQKEEAFVTDLRERMGEDAFDTAWLEGQGFSIEQAITYLQKRRGSRKRPSSGWESLTPVELQVARLVAEGLTNPQIADRLYITRGTVKVHVSHIFRKLGVAHRAELAAEVTRRDL